MRLKYSLFVIMAVLLLCCKKETTTIVVPPPTEKPVLLKDIVIPNLPSPYYHFEYDHNGSINKASFASGSRMYEVVYTGNKISELRNNTIANKDHLQYIYEGGRVSVIKYLDEAGIEFRRCFLTYQGDQLRTIEWERKVVAGFELVRTMAFVYHPDGNVLEITDHRHPVSGQQEATYTTRFEQYDNKINTDGFSLVHENDDHLLLLPAVQLQKNNPRKLIRSGSGINYTIDYTYTYDDRNVPVTRTGDAVFANGPNTGQRWQTNATFTYYP